MRILPGFYTQCIFNTVFILLWVHQENQDVHLSKFEKQTNNNGILLYFSETYNIELPMYPFRSSYHITKFLYLLVENNRNIYHLPGYLVFT